MEQCRCLGLMTSTQNPQRVGTFCLLGSQHLGQVFIILTGWKAVSHVLILTHWPETFAKQILKNKGLWIGQEVKAQFVELSVEITSELWWSLRGRGSEGSTHCLPSTAFTLMKPWTRWKPTTLKGRVYTILQCTSLIKNSSKEAPISVTLLCLITLWFRNIFLRLWLTLSKARNFTIVPPLMWRIITKCFRTTYIARSRLMP